MTAVSTASPREIAHSGPSPTSSRWTKTQLPLIAGFVLLLGVAAASVWFMIDNERFTTLTERTLQVRSTAYRLLTLVQDAETGQRGYLLTGDTNYLAPYENGRVEAVHVIREMEVLVGGNHAAAMTRLKIAIDAKLRELAFTVEAKKQGQDEVALQRVKTNVGNKEMERVRLGIQQIEREEQQALADARGAAEANDKLLVVATLAGILLVLALAAYTIIAFRRTTSALVRAQDELRDNNNNLEGLVTERVAELQIANDEIQRFAYIVSHDLRAPLVNVMGFTSELETASADIATFLKDVEERAPDLVKPDMRVAVETDLPEALGFIRTSTAKMDRLINAILKLSREGRRVLTPQTIDLRALVEAQGESLSQQLSSSQSELIIQPDLPGLISDRLAVEQIFGNLIENATKYLAPGRPGRIEVRGGRVGSHLRYEIVDNGRGIDTKDFERIFELFRRSGEQDKPGEGIGLAYVRNLARRLGGNVTVDSTFGEGSTFTVTLPAVFNPNRKSKS